MCDTDLTTLFYYFVVGCCRIPAATAAGRCGFFSSRAALLCVVSANVWTNIHKAFARHTKAYYFFFEQLQSQIWPESKVCKW